MAHKSTEQAVRAVRDALGARNEREALAAVEALRGKAAEVGPIAAVDLLERCACFGTAAVIDALYDALGEFVYEAWALALALRCANESCACALLDRGVDLLDTVHQPTSYRALLPHEGTFTRFALTRYSPTLFLNPMDPTVANEVFEPFRGRANDSLMPPTYSCPTDLTATCDLVALLAEEGRFDAEVFDDLLRAALIRAWHALRHEAERDEHTANICLVFAERMLAMYHMRGQGNHIVQRILGSLIVPRTDPRIVSFVCDQAPDVFFERLRGNTWLQSDIDLVLSMVSHLSPSTEEHNGLLLLILARAGRMEQLMQMSDWPRTFTSSNVDAALQAASSAGHAEAATWLLARKPHQSATAQLDDLFL